MGKKSSQVGSRIAALRKERGLTQEQLAERLHVTRQTVSSWETANSYPDVEMLAALAQALEVSVEQLIYGEAQRQAAPEELPRWMSVGCYLFALVMVCGIAWNTFGAGMVPTGLFFCLLGTLYYGILVIRDELRRR